MEQGDRVELGAMAWAGDASVEAFWRQLAERVLGWLAEHGVPVRDAVVLLPFAQHLSLARRAFAAAGPWLPRLETTRSLASALGPQPLARPGQLSGDGALDLHHAQAILRHHRLDGGDLRADRLHARQLLELAQALQSVAFTWAPGRRPDYWRHVSATLGQAASGDLEARLAQLACEWAQHLEAPATDALFRHPARAWVVLESGRPDALARSVQAQAACPALRLSIAGPGEGQAPSWQVQELSDAGSLPAATAAQVLRLVSLRQGPVLMPALDRALLRQVVALLAPFGLCVQDETGGSLATTGLAAALRHLARAALQGHMDDVLAWAKGPLAPAGLQGVRDLEAWARRHRVSRWGGESPPGAPAAAWRRLVACTQALQLGPSRRPLQQWLHDLKQVLAACGVLDGGEWEQLQPGIWRACLEVLWLARAPWPGSAAEALMGQPMGASEWLAWLEEALQAPAPNAPSTASAPHVVITPLNRAPLRPFAAAVLAGGDAGRWSVGAATPALVGQATALALGLPNREAAQVHQWEALQQLARLPQVVCLHAQHSDGVPLEWAPPLLRLQAASAHAWSRIGEARQAVVPAPAAEARAEVALPGWLPARWTASQVASLRDCPYQFFARSRLGLDDEDEIDRDPDARDWGRWLHAVLQVAHDLGDPVRHWSEACRQVLDRDGVAPADAWPFLALLQRWGPAYLAWWQQESVAGRRALDSERKLEAAVWAGDPLLGQVAWVGRADRIDALGDGGTQLLDFKTSSVSSLKERVAADPQLPFYVALLDRLGEPVASAAYLALDSKTRALQTVPCAEADVAARTLTEGLAQDLRDVHAGVPLRALGEGAACEHCAVRGLCRRDDWSAA